MKELMPENVLLSERRVEEADVPALPVIVIGDEPMMVNGVQEAVPEHDAVVVAMSRREKVIDAAVFVTEIGYAANNEVVATPEPPLPEPHAIPVEVRSPVALKVAQPVPCPVTQKVDAERRDVLAVVCALG